MFTDETWNEVQRELQQMLQFERDRLEDKTLDINATNFTRGRISAIKELLALPEKREALTRNVEPA
jgi:hypothetical protein